MECSEVACGCPPPRYVECHRLNGWVGHQYRRQDYRCQWLEPVRWRFCEDLEERGDHRHPDAQSV